MESVLAGSVVLRLSLVSRVQKERFRGRVYLRCSLRDAGPRGQLWRSRILSSEAIQAVQALKLAKSSSRTSSSPSSKLDPVFEGRIARLLKADLIAVLEELQRQNEWELVQQVFQHIHGEDWYKPDLRLYSDMIFNAGKNKQIEIAEDLFSAMKMEGLQPDSRAYTEMIGAYLQVDMVEKAMGTYRLMKESRAAPSELTLTILIKNLEKAEEQELATAVRRDCAEYLDHPERFLQEIDTRYPKRRSVRLF